ncbi:MAG: DUF3105 domain-containing protein [Actinomycetota bacterium]|nr:DUF3105 domain-containing protein [Actinomycetota bacterium]
MFRRLAPLTLLAAAVLGACSSGSDDPDDSGPAVVDADEGIEGVLAIRIPSATHVEGEVEYDRTPPAGGDHNPAPARCGFYDEAIPPEFIVHSMEHGAVWLAYAPDLDEASVTLIHDLVRDNPETIATVHPDLEPGVAVVASAWARQLSLTAADDPRLAEFVEQYQDGDQAPEASVDCAGQGVGVPLP